MVPQPSAAGEEAQYVQDAHGVQQYVQHDKPDGGYVVVHVVVNFYQDIEHARGLEAGEAPRPLQLSQCRCW
jgi:hypothetical protein